MRRIGKAPRSPASDPLPSDTLRCGRGWCRMVRHVRNGWVTYTSAVKHHHRWYPVGSARKTPRERWLDWASKAEVMQLCEPPDPSRGLSAWGVLAVEQEGQAYTLTYEWGHAVVEPCECGCLGKQWMMYLHEVPLLGLAHERSTLATIATSISSAALARRDAVLRLSPTELAAERVLWKRQGTVVKL